MAKTTLTISSKNYSSWSLRGWLLTKFSGLEFEEVVTAPDDASARAEILLLSSSILVPCLRHEGATVWDTLAIAEYLNEIMAGCRAVAGGPRAAGALPLDLRRNPFRLHDAARLAAGQSEGPFSRLQDLVAGAGRYRPGLHHLARVPAKSGGPFLFGSAPWRMRCMRRW